jgi:hypothetical protein
MEDTLYVHLVDHLGADTTPSLDGPRALRSFPHGPLQLLVDAARPPRRYGRRRTVGVYTRRRVTGALRPRLAAPDSRNEVPSRRKSFAGSYAW